jgi:hypothetical protein
LILSSLMLKATSSQTTCIGSETTMKRVSNWPSPLFRNRAD